MVINYVKLHAEPAEGKTLDISEYKHYWFIPKTCPVKMKENEMGNEKELIGSTIKHTINSSIVLTLLELLPIDAARAPSQAARAPSQARPALKY